MLISRLEGRWPGATKVGACWEVTERHKKVMVAADLHELRETTGTLHRSKALRHHDRRSAFQSLPI